MSSATVLPFGGGELSSFDPFDSSTFETTSGSYDSAFARCCIRVANPNSGCTSPTWAEAATFWHHQQVVFSANNGFFGEVAWLLWMNAAGTVVAKLTSTYNHTTVSSPFNLYTLQGSTMTLVGSVTISESLVPIDVKLVAGAAGVAQLYVSGTLRINASGLAHTQWAGVAQCQLGGNYGVGGVADHSEIICDSVPHIGDRLKTYPVDTVSAVNTGWTGAVGNVNKIVLNDSTFVFAASASLTSTYFASGFSLGTFNVVAVIVAIRINCGASGPQNVEVALRTAGTNYFSSSIAVGNGYQATTKSWTTNPNTSAAWLAINAQAVEGGMESFA